MRTGAEYREALRDGRKVWLMGGGAVDDVTTHPATRAMVEEYASWYDRHLDPAWQDLLLSPANGGAERVPWGYVLPKTSEDLIGMGRSFAKTIFLSAGNITHTPAYGNLIQLGVLSAAQAHDAPDEQIAEAKAYREGIARTGRFLTYCGGAPIIGHFVGTRSGHALTRRLLAALFADPASWCETTIAEAGAIEAVVWPEARHAVGA